MALTFSHDNSSGFNLKSLKQVKSQAFITRGPFIIPLMILKKYEQKEK